MKHSRAKVLLTERFNVIGAESLFDTGSSNVVLKSYADAKNRLYRSSSLILRGLD